MNMSRADFAAYRVRALGWYMQRSRRERLLLAILAALLIGFALVTFVIRPLYAERTGALADIRAYDMLAARMQQARAIPSAATALRTGDAATVAQASAAQFGLVLHDVTMHGSGLHMQLSAAPYEGVVRWLADLAQSSDLRVRHLALVRGTLAGTVDGDVVLAS